MSEGDKRLIPAPNLAAPQLTAGEFIDRIQKIEAEVAKVIVGQREVVRQVLICLVGGGHALLEGVPGLGKTALVKTLGQVLDLSFSRVQFTPDLMPADITGTEVLTAGEFRFRPGPVFCNLLLADEINRATPKTQSALLEAMHERSVTAGETTRTLPSPFFVLATQNPIEMEGTYPLPEAQLDRFFLKIAVGFPGPAELQTILERTITGNSPSASKVAGAEDILAMGRLAREVPVASPVNQYAISLLLATHPDQPGAPDRLRRYLRAGASPRGLQSLVLGAKARALLEGRLNVSFEDLRSLAVPALAHRLVLNFEARAEGITPRELVDDILETIRPGE